MRARLHHWDRCHPLLPLPRRCYLLHKRLRNHRLQGRGDPYRSSLPLIQDIFHKSRHRHHRNYKNYLSSKGVRQSSPHHRNRHNRRRHHHRHNSRLHPMSQQAEQKPLLERKSSLERMLLEREWGKSKPLLDLKHQFPPCQRKIYGPAPHYNQYCLARLKMLWHLENMRCVMSNNEGINCDGVGIEHVVFSRSSYLKQFWTSQPRAQSHLGMFLRLCWNL